MVVDRDGTVYVPVDGDGAESVLFATSDHGKTWRDIGGRTAGRHTSFILGKDGSIVGFGGKNSEIDGFMPKAVSRDAGKTWVSSKTPFPPLNSGQRPSILRLASGRLFFVADKYASKPPPRRPGAYVAWSDDDGETWKTRDLPAVTRRADLVFAAVGRAEMVRGGWIKPGATVIDVGINRVTGADGKGRIVGDVADCGGVGSLPERDPGRARVRLQERGTLFGRDCPQG